MNLKKIMLIEDDFDTQFLFSECLRAENYDVVSMEHGKNALEYIETNGSPDLILMDLNTPFLSPEEFVTKMRSISTGVETPVILVSGKSDIDEYAKKLGAKNFMRKPFDLDPLLSMISKSLQ
jgi:DNA-binding response OmpR family regulator